MSKNTMSTSLFAIGVFISILLYELKIAKIVIALLAVSGILCLIISLILMFSDLPHRRIARRNKRRAKLARKQEI